MPPIARVSRRGHDRIRAGHPWIYRSDVAAVEAEPGDLVRVVTDHERRVGWALYSSASQIALRMVSTSAAAGPLDESAWLAERIAAAAAYRASLGIDGTAYRLINGEADRLPGLVVDRYGDGEGAVLVVQTLTQGMDRRIAAIVDLLVRQEAPRGILARNDPKVRRLEGLDEQVEVMHGDVPDAIDVRDGALRFRVDVRHGQKTGLFLDQRENHAAAGHYARGRALDAFTYHGGFALHLASRAASVIALDSSGPAIAATQANAAANGLTNIETREVNVFDELRELETSSERFDTIVLDPPAFAKNKAAVERAAAGYKEINLRALRILAPGGHLVTCSCSYNVSEDLFLAILEQAAADAHATVALVEKRMQARDHPVLVGVPETHYLKCFVLRKLG